jgi:hypothetical protein
MRKKDFVVHTDKSMFQQPPMQDSGDEDEDFHPCHEDEEYFEARPDAEEKEEAISKFMDGLGESECKSFDTQHSLLGGLPVPVQTKDRGITHTAALEGGFIREMDEREQKVFTPPELLLYNSKHAVEYR